MQRILGKLLHGIHAGETHLLCHRDGVAQVPSTIQIDSPSLTAARDIPLQYAGPGVGDNHSPALVWSQIPADTAELVLVLEDPDAPLPRPFVHLIAYGIPPDRTDFAVGELSAAGIRGMAYGRNTFGSSGYQGPRALPGHGRHRYVFQIFALSQSLVFTRPPRLDELHALMRGKVLAQGRCDGFFEQT